MLSKKLYALLILITVLGLSGALVSPTNAFTVYPTSATCTASGGVMGDVNHDSKVNDLDITVVQHMMVGTEPISACGDMDADGIIGAVDFTLVRQLSWDIDAGRVIAPTAELWDNSFYNPYRLPPCQTIFGDVNGDLKADYQDESIIQYMIVQKLPPSICADSDNDGFISPVDYSVSRVISMGGSYPSLEKPVITLNGANQLTLEVHTPYVDAGATVTDTQDDAAGLAITIVTDTSAINNTFVGTYIVTYNATDSDGNLATPRQRQVNFVDTTIPVITLVGANPQAIARGTAYTELGATATDNYDAPTAVTNIDASAVNTAVAGTYTVTYNYTDANGNPAAQVTRTVNVIAPSIGGGGYSDTTPPTNLSLSINNGAEITNDRNVSLTIGATDANYMMISNASDFSGAEWETYATTKTWQLTADYEHKTVYAKFKDNANNVSTSVSASITLVPPQVPDSEVLGEKYVAPGTLVKRTDITSVYFIGADNLRHAFPNESVFFSYYPDFSEVQTVSAETLAAIPLGMNVTMNAGTWLVKIQSAPEVYAVEPSGVLRWISSEQIAVGLYGSNWNAKIVDVAPTFFIDYKTGAKLETLSYPTGQLIAYQGSDSVYYVDQAKKRFVSTEVFQNNNYQNKFVIKNVAASIAYENGTDLPVSGMEVVIAFR
jgi:hypothetical protein